MLIKVCDAICGAGKTQSCIQMMNSSSTDKHFIFITPYLDEVDRIKSSCKDKEFTSPERSRENGYTKLNDLNNLLRAQKNIASTHALFACYTDETKRLIKEGNYILVLDEVIDLFQPVELDGGDINLLLRNNIATKENGNIVWGDDEYKGVLFSEIMQMSQSKNLIDYDGSFYFWSIPIDIFNCFTDAYVLTYLFEYQLLKYYFNIYQLSYELIGTKKVGGKYMFCPLDEMNRSIDLRDKIHILDNSKYNAVGDKNFSLSMSWHDRELKCRNSENISTLKNNLYNYFRKSRLGAKDIIWTTFNKSRNALKGKGYTKGFVTFNKRATNEFASRHYLAYCVNVFLQPWVKNFFAQHGVEGVSQDMYALSVLIQWIFRSAIRRGEEIYIYIPSRRMRYLLEEWLENLSKGEDLKEIKFKNNSKKNSSREELLKINQIWRKNEKL